MIGFKSERQKSEFGRIHPRLSGILGFAESCAEEMGESLILTDIRRSRMEQIDLYRSLVNPDTGRPYRVEEVPFSVHETDPCRGTDAVTEKRRVPDMERIADRVNGGWRYDPNRPELKVALYHDVGMGHHIHFQVDENTVSRENANEIA